ncbi:MAG: cytochrome C [Deltaproteobacteria bacterium]|nr:MAG: cytochrome C [Deltaproteobacteria bacterium]
MQRAASLGVAVGVAVAVWSAARAGAPRLAEFARQPVSEVVFPPQSLPLRFSHARHLRLGSVDCDFCHEDAAESTSSLDNLMPGEDVCAMCHAIDRDQPTKPVAAGKPPAACAACHPGFAAGGAVARVVVPAPNLKFNHRAHVGRKISCQTCHGDLLADGVDLATRDQLPRMRLCLQCHDGRTATDACTTCHLAEGDGRIQTAFAEGLLQPSGVLRGDAHDLSFRTRHAAVAKQDAAYCDNCHHKAFCIDCHQGTAKPMDFHGNDYVSIHAIDARRNNPDCSACHRLQTFCVGCHGRTGVGWSYDPVEGGGRKGSEFAGAFLTGDGSRRFHPDGWATFGARGPNHHAVQAQRNIRQCASCHREPFCTTCHSAEPGNPYRVNPHPAGWATSRRCRALAARAGRMCLRCHVDAVDFTCR